MAVEGRNFRDTISHGSDDWIDHPCSPCAKDRKNVAAVKYCVECDVNLCSTCLTHHNKFAVMKGHQLLDRTQKQIDQRPKLPSQRCKEHGGKLIDVYCPLHDTVGCATCIAVDHSTCKGTKFIPHVASGIDADKEFQALEDQMKTLHAKLINMKRTQKADLLNLQQQKQDLQREVKSIRQKVNDHFDKLENQLLDEIEDVFLPQISQASEDIREVDNALSMVKKREESFQKVTREYASENFVEIKLATEKQKRSWAVLKKLERSGSRPAYKLKLDRGFEKYQKEITSMGHVVERFVPRSAKLIGEYSVKSKSDTKISEKIHGMCISATGNIVITDYKNKCLKVLDQYYNIAVAVKLPDNPFNICSINSTLLAVTLPNLKKVQYVSQEPVSLKSSFGVGDRCRGITHHNGLIYVCCGGSQFYKEEGPGHVELYSINGPILRTVYVGCDAPMGVQVSDDGTLFLVAASDSVMIYNKGGILQSQYRYNELEQHGTFSKISPDLFCLPGFISNNVALVSDDGKFLQQLLSEKDGIKMPLGICFDKRQSRLIVNCHSTETIKVFHLST